MKRVAMLITVATSISFSASSAVLFGGYIKHSDNSNKDGVYYIGAYTNYTFYPYKLELDLEYTTVNYKDTTPKYKQTDLTLVGEYNLRDDTLLKLGIHNMIIDQEGNPNNYDNILFAGFSHFKPYKYNFGLDIYRSDYDGFNVVQISPKGGFNFGDYRSKLGSFYLGGQLNLIDITRAGYSKKRDYLNLDLSLKNFNGPLTTELFASIGKHSYKVSNGGFSVYNLKEEYKYSYGISAAYSFKDKSNLKTTYAKSRLSEGNKNITSDNYMLSFSKSW